MRRPPTGTMRSRIAIAAKDKRIDAQFFRRMGVLIKPYWWGRAAWRPFLLLGVGLAVTSVVTGLEGMTTLLLGSQTNALVARQAPLFWRITSQLAAIATAITLIGWIGEISMSYLKVHWRKSLTKYLTERYLARRTYYEINLEQDLDNPDQRIQEDVGPLCSTLTDMPQNVASITLSLSVQVAIMNHISPAMTWALFIFIGVQSASYFFVYRPSVGIAWDIKVAEADLRYGILHVRDNAETIAFYGGEAAERVQLLTRIDHAIRQGVRSIRNNIRVQFFLNTFKGVSWILPLAFVVPLFLAGKIPYGAIASAAVAGTMIQGSLAKVEQFIPNLTVIAPNVVRLAQIIEKSEAIKKGHAPSGLPSESTIDVRHSDDAVRLHRVSYLTPGGERSLVRDLTLELKAGERMIIVGQTGVGKSSLLRVLAGLWRRGAGVVHTPPLSRALFMPQKPYMTLGTLRSQLLYPGHIVEEVEDALFLEALDKVRLPSLAALHGGLDAEKDWSRLLSLGEQQRVSFARFLINRPEFVFLDEATSAVDVPMEAHLYGLMVEAGVTIVSVAHRTSVLPFHDLVLDLREEGWSFQPVKDFVASQSSRPNLAQARAVLQEITS